jgi:hypothetical protein
MTTDNLVYNCVFFIRRVHILRKRKSVWHLHHRTQPPNYYMLVREKEITLSIMSSKAYYCVFIHELRRAPKESFLTLYSLPRTCYNSAQGRIQHVPWNLKLHKRRVHAIIKNIISKSPYCPTCCSSPYHSDPFIFSI